MSGDDVPRGLSLEQAQILSLQRRQEEMMEQIAQISHTLARLNQPQMPRRREPQRRINREDGDDEGPGTDEEFEEQPEQRRQPRRGGNHLKLKIPTFKGTSSPEEYLEWVQRVDKIFECQDYTEVTKCKLAAIEFTDYANLWWENLKAQRRRDGLEEITSWRTMKRLMERRFVPEYYKQELYMSLQSLRQGGMSVQDYVQEFEMLMMRCDLQEPQEQTIARFLGGLNYEIANVVELQPFVFLQDVIKLAIKVER